MDHSPRRTSLVNIVLDATEVLCAADVLCAAEMLDATKMLSTTKMLGATKTANMSTAKTSDVATAEAAAPHMPAADMTTATHVAPATSMTVARLDTRQTNQRCADAKRERDSEVAEHGRTLLSKDSLCPKIAGRQERWQADRKSDYSTPCPK